MMQIIIMIDIPEGNGDALEADQAILAFEDVIELREAVRQRAFKNHLRNLRPPLLARSNGGDGAC